MKEFNQSDIQEHSCVAGAGELACSRADLINNPPAWLARGLQETATGYGARLNSGYSIRYCGRTYRVYVTQYGNSGSCWFIARGRKIFVSAF